MALEHSATAKAIYKLSNACIYIHSPYIMGHMGVSSAARRDTCPNYNKSPLRVPRTRACPWRPDFYFFIPVLDWRLADSLLLVPLRACVCVCSTHEQPIQI